MTARSLLAVLTNLREDELGLDVEPCTCWFGGGHDPGAGIRVTPAQILLCRTPTTEGTP